MARSDRPLDAGKRKIDALARLRRRLGRRFNRNLPLGQRRFHVRLDLIQFLPDDALQIRRGRFQPVVGNLRDHAGLAPQPRITHRLPIRVVRRRRKLAIELRAQFREHRRNLLRRIHAQLRESLFRRLVRHGKGQ